MNFFYYEINLYTSHTNIRIKLFVKTQLHLLETYLWQNIDMSLVMRKPAFCIYESKDADQLRGNRKADQRLCFCYIDSTIPLLPKSEISSLYPFSVTVQPGLCGTWSETPKTGFLTTRLISGFVYCHLHVTCIVSLACYCSIFSSPEPKAHKVSL